MSKFPCPWLFAHSFSPARFCVKSSLTDLRRHCKSSDAWQEALDGRVQPHHRILLKHILAHVAFLEQELEQLQQDIEQRLPPFEEEMGL